MTSPLNNNEHPAQGMDPGKTGDLSAARQAAAVHAAEAKVAARRDAAATAGIRPGVSAAKEAVPPKPTRRSARGSDVAAREKQERRDANRRRLRAGTVSAAGENGRTGDSGQKASRLSLGKRARASKSSRSTQQDAMRYATDNRFVRWFYELTTGPRRYVFYALVVLLVGAGVYAPVRDFYIAHRTEVILREQKAIRESYNEMLGSEVEGLLSQEGIEDAARRDYGMVMPGEKTIAVEGLDENGNPVVVEQGKTGDGSAADAENGSEASNGAASKGDSGKLKGEDAADKSKTGSSSGELGAGGRPTTSAEVEAAERAVLENSAWYWKVLDTLFFFDGVNGMAVVSTGE